MSDPDEMAAKLSSLEGFAADCAKTHYRRVSAVIFEHCESPIEKLFIGALIGAVKEKNDRIAFFIGPEIGPDVPAPERYVAFPQFEIENYRIDFLIGVGFEDHRKFFAVECDGHDFHERTKEQAERDRYRDRQLTGLGYVCVRFTGSEIWRDPYDCAWQFIHLASQVLAGSLVG